MGHLTTKSVLCAAALIALGCLFPARAFVTTPSYSKPTTHLNDETLLPIQKDFKWGYINTTGKIVIEPQFDSADEFRDGLAFVTFPNREKPLKPGQTTPELKLGYGFIDRSGRVVLELESPAYLAGDGFYEGLTKFWSGESGRTLYGYIDTKGAVKIKPQFTYAYEFVEGLAAVCVDEKCGYINKSGQRVIPFKYRLSMPFSDGFAVVGFDHEKIGFINKSGELVVEPQFGNFVGTIFREGLSPVAYSGGKWGYIDAQGVIVIPMQFDHATPFSEGLAAVQVDGKWGYIDRTGKFVIKPQFRSAGGFSEGVAPINSEMALSPTQYTGQDTGFIDKTGKIVLTLQFNGASSFRNGIAQVDVEGKRGYINKNGDFVWKPTR